MEYFKFNGVSSETLGLIIKEMPPIVKAAKNIESISVNGRNGNLHIDNDNYNSVPITIACIIKDLSKIDLIKSVLEGYGTLELSTIPGREFNAMIANQIEFSKYLSVLREFPLQLELDPISKNITETIKEIQENKTIEIGGTYITYPILTITGTGNITINNISLTVLETDLEIDCELMNVTKNLINKNDKCILNNDRFPVLYPGENSIVLGEGITKIKIKYKEGWL